VTRAKLAALKDGKGSARSNQGGCQIDLPRSRLQGYFLESGECKAATKKGYDADGGMKPA
jgi:hypothetical protein